MFQREYLTEKQFLSLKSLRRGLMARSYYVQFPHATLPAKLHFRSETLKTMHDVRPPKKHHKTSQANVEFPKLEGTTTAIKQIACQKHFLFTLATFFATLKGKHKPYWRIRAWSKSLKYLTRACHFGCVSDCHCQERVCTSNLTLRGDEEGGKAVFDDAT